MADVNVRAHAIVGTLIDEAHHRIDIVEQTQAERLQFEGNIELMFAGVISELPAGFEAPVPLGFGRDDFALPNVFSQNEEDVFGAPGLRQVNKSFATFEVKVAHGFIEIDQSHCDHWQRNNRQPQFRGGVGDETNLALGDANGFGEDVHRVKPDSGNVLQPGRGIDADLLEGAVDDAEFHSRVISLELLGNSSSWAPAAGRETNIVGSIPVRARYTSSNLVII